MSLWLWLYCGTHTRIMPQFECISGFLNGFAPTNLVFWYVFVQTHKLTIEVDLQDIVQSRREGSLGALT